jgi:hypothetical protein
LQRFRYAFDCSNAHAARSIPPIRAIAEPRRTEGFVVSACGTPFPPMARFHAGERFGHLDRPGATAPLTSHFAIVPADRQRSCSATQNLSSI